MSHQHHHHHTLAPSGQGTVMLDIGGTIGALIIHTDARWLGHEIEVSPAADPSKRTHAAVRARHTTGGTVHCVVIDALPAGTYLVWQNALNPLTHLEVRGGAVTEYEWPATAVPGRGLVSL
ncbi:phospholipase [Actinoplanes sp. NPDC049596]|uniref:phospholipase n=1 Tax=unclassified Actinoplanes TaxID=2626549 RepID=UPI00343D387F